VVYVSMADGGAECKYCGGSGVCDALKENYTRTGNSSVI
jgi:hypothetical protein